MDLGGLLGIVVAALAILGAGGSAWAFLADKGNKARLDGLRKDISDRDVRIDFLEELAKRLESERATVDIAVVALRSEIASANRYIEGSEGALKAINDLVAAHHDMAVTGIATLETQLADVLRIVADRRQTPPENITREVRDA